MNTGLNFDIRPINQFCEEHKTQMVSVFGRPTCKQCAEQLIQRVHQETDQELNKRIKEFHVAGSHIPERHKNSGFGNYVVNHEGQKNAKEQCKALFRDFRDGINRNLIMLGRTGTGKTHLACAVIRCAIETRKFARYTTSEDLAADIAAAWKRADDSEKNAIWRYVEYDLLIIDEYGLHDRHEKHLELVHKVLYERYDAGKPTMLISNMTLQDVGDVKGLISDLGDRLWSRFQHDGLTVVECNWMDNRVGGGV